MATWYHDTAPALPAFPPLEGAVRADLCVIGGGLTGLGAALSAAERGLCVVLLEQGRIGAGASGRNGGQVHSGQRHGQAWLEAQYGHARARALWDLAEDAKRHLAGLIDRHAIACDYTPGLIYAAHKPSYARDLAAQAQDMAARRYGYATQVLDRAALQALVRSPDYHGGVLDPGGGHLHPVKLLHGLATAAARLGVTIHETSQALAIEEGPRPAVLTARGRVDAQAVIVAGDAGLRGLVPRAEGHMLPIASTIAVTEPLGGRLAELVTTQAAVADTRFVVNYFRPLPDGRLLFGGGESYSTRPVADPARLVRRALAAIFPQAADVPFTHAWSGVVGITANRMPYVRRLSPHVLVACGYSGQGVLLAPFFGHVLAQATAGTLGAFDLLASIKVPPLPGGTRLRHPLMWLALTWGALRDRV